MVNTSQRLLLRAALIFLVLAGFIAPALAQRGALTAARNLEQLSAQAATIVRGHIVFTRVERHPELTNLYTVVVTMRVAETLKGEPARTLTYRQYIWDIRDREDAAGYKKGGEVLLLLNPVSRYGLTSPAGMEQGRFRIVRDAQGRELAINGRGNAGLFRGMETRDRGLSARAARTLAQHRSGPVPLEDLKEIIARVKGRDQ